MDFEQLSELDKTYLEQAKFQAAAFVASYLERLETDSTDEDAVNDALSLWFKGASQEKEERLSVFEGTEEEDEDEEQAA